MYRQSRQQTFSFSPVWLIIGICLIIFIASIINPDLVFFNLGLQRFTLDQHPWTILTNIFVHDGFWHIFFNMFTLYFFGTFLLQIIGEAKFWLVFLGGGLLGGVFFLLFASPFAIAVGASGAVFSLGGALAVLRPKIPVVVFPLPVPMPLWVAVVGGFLLVSFLPGVAWQAHLGGIIFGLVVGYIFKRSRYVY